MKKLLLALAILIPFLTIAQKPTKTIGTINQIDYARGGLKVDSFMILPKILDTLAYHGDFIIRNGVPFVWNGTAYLHLRTDTLSSLTQVPSDWNAVSGVAQILNKPTLATVATSGSYTDLINKPSIPVQFAPVQGYGVVITGAYPNIIFATDSTIIVNKVFLAARNYLTANQTITFTPGAGDVTGGASGTTSLTPTLTIGANKVLYSKIQTVVSHAVIGNPTGSTATPRATYIGYGNLFDGDTIKIDTTLLKTVFPGGGGGGNPFADNVALVKNSADATKLLIINIGAFTTGTTRTLTAQNANYTIAGINLAQTFSSQQTFSTAPIFSTLNVAGGLLWDNGSGVVAQTANGTAVQTLHGGAGSTPVFGLVGLTTDVTGVLPAVNGGTAQSTYTTGDFLYASGVNTLSKRAIGTANQILAVSGGIPTWVNPSVIESLLTLSNMNGPLSIAKGGTGQTSAVNAINALVPSQTGNAGKFITTNGAAVAWGTPAGGGLTSVGLSGADFTYSNNPLVANGNIGITLATVNSNVGTWGDGTHVGVFVTNGKGLITGASNVAITYPAINLFTGTGLVALNDSTFEWNGPLTKNTTIAGAGFSLNLGTSGSKITTLSINTSAAGGIALNGYVVNGYTIATDANFNVITTFSELPAITVGRNAVLPTGPVAGTTLTVLNLNGSGNNWTFTNGTVKSLAGATITTLTNQISYKLVFNGTNWISY